jgi:hypothetical protein
MASVRFYIDDRSKKKIKPVSMVISHEHQRKVANAITKKLNIRIPVSMWNFNCNGDPEAIKGTSPEAITYRDKLKEIKHQVEVVIPNYLTSHGKQVTSESIYNQLMAHYGLVSAPKEQANLELITDIIDDYIKIHSPTFSTSTISTYKMANRLLTEYAEKEGQSLLIKNIGIPWLAKFVNHLCCEKPKGAGLENASIITMMLKVNAAVRYYEHPGWKMKKVTGHLRVFKNEETDTIQLPLSEIIKIYKFDCLVGGKLKLGWMKVRDLFVWSFFNGHRHNELYQLSKSGLDKIKNMDGSEYDIVNYVSDKTGKPNQAVLNNICMEIIDRWKDQEFTVERTDKKTKEKIIYPDPLLPVVNLDTCNDYLEAILEEIAFRESVAAYGPEFSRGKMDLYEPVSFYRKQLKVRYMGATRKEEFIPLYKYITFKTSRRSLASELADAGLTDGDISSVLNNDPETARKYYAKRDRTIANIRTTEILTNKANELMEKKKAGS